MELLTWLKARIDAAVASGSELAPEVLTSTLLLGGESDASSDDGSCSDLSGSGERELEEGDIIRVEEVALEILTKVSSDQIPPPLNLPISPCCKISVPHL